MRPTELSEHSEMFSNVVQKTLNETCHLQEILQTTLAGKYLNKGRYCDSLFYLFNFSILQYHFKMEDNLSIFKFLEPVIS